MLAFSKGLNGRPKSKLTGAARRAEEATQRREKERIRAQRPPTALTPSNCGFGSLFERNSFRSTAFVTFFERGGAALFRWGKELRSAGWDGSGDAKNRRRSSRVCFGKRSMRHARGAALRQKKKASGARSTPRGALGVGDGEERRSDGKSPSRAPGRQLHASRDGHRSGYGLASCRSATRRATSDRCASLPAPSPCPPPHPPHLPAPPPN